MPTTVADLEAVRAHLHAEAARIRSEYETRLPDIEGDLAALDRIMSRMPALAGVDRVSDVPSEAAEEAGPAAPSPATRAPRHPRQVNWKRELAGLSQREAIIRIAEIGDGTLQLIDVGHIFLDAGLAKTKPKDMKGQIHRLIKESGRFEAIAAGTYRLRAQAEPAYTELAEAEPTGR
jgi:hypothetical protein